MRPKKSRFPALFITTMSINWMFLAEWVDFSFSERSIWMLTWHVGGHKRAEVLGIEKFVIFSTAPIPPAAGNESKMERKDVKGAHGICARDFHAQRCIMVCNGVLLIDCVCGIVPSLCSVWIHLYLAGCKQKEFQAKAKDLCRIIWKFRLFVWIWCYFQLISAFTPRGEDLRT